MKIRWFNPLFSDWALVKNGGSIKRLESGGVFLGLIACAVFDLWFISL